jgi:hypothetical protein
MVLRSRLYLDRREMKWREIGENCIMSNFTTCEMGRACSTNGEKRNAYRILEEKPE